MMDALRVTAALALPWAFGGLVVSRLLPRGPAWRWSLVLGYGFAVGIVALTLLMRAMDRLWSWLGFAPLAAALVGLGAVAIALPAVGSRGALQPAREPPPTPAWQQALVLLVLALLVLRFVGLGLEVLWRPLFPWDAAMHWATKARVWSDAGQLLPFVSDSAWLAAPSARVYTDFHPDYPITVPLVQTWMSLALGRWDESLINLPWVALYAALGLAFFGQARAAHASVLRAVLFTYLTLSLPLLNTQVALAGYADIFMAACYGMAVMAFHQWTLTRESGQGALAIVLACACPLIKLEGLFWLLTLVVGGLAALVPPRRLLALALWLAVLAALALFLVPDDLVVAGHSLRRLHLAFHPEAVVPLLQGLLFMDNWHLLIWFALALPPLALVLRIPGGARYRGIGAALLCALGLLVFLFLGTGYSQGAVRLDAVNRLTLQLAPAWAFLCLLLFEDLSRERVPTTRSA